jgi:hypothetical protein
MGEVMHAIKVSVSGGKSVTIVGQKAEVESAIESLKNLGFPGLHFTPVDLELSLGLGSIQVLAEDIGTMGKISAVADTALAFEELREAFVHTPIKLISDHRVIPERYRPTKFKRK